MILAKALTSLFITNSCWNIFMIVTKTFLATKASCSIAKTTLRAKLAKFATGIFLTKITLAHFDITLRMTITATIDTAIWASPSQLTNTFVIWSIWTLKVKKFVQLRAEQIHTVNLNNYFNLHICLSFRIPSVCLTALLPCEGPSHGMYLDFH